MLRLLKALKDGHIDWKDLEGAKITRVETYFDREHHLTVKIKNKHYKWIVITDWE